MHLGIRWSGLRTKIIAWSFIPTAIILMAVALVGFFAYQQVTEELTIQSSGEVARLSAGQLAAELDEFSTPLTALARTSSIYEGRLLEQRAALAQARERLLIFDGGVLVLDNYGKVVATQPARPEIEGSDWSTRDYFREIIRVSSTVYSDVLTDGPGGDPVIIVAVPITNARGEMAGVLAGMFRVGAGSASSFYGSIVKLRVAGDTSSYVVDHNGHVIYHTDEDSIGRDWSTQPVVQQITGGKAGVLRTRDPHGREIIASMAPVPGTPWGLVIEQSWEALLASGRSYRSLLLLLLALGIIVPTLVVMFGVGRITGPITRLIDAAQAIASGNFGQQITVHTGDELEQLARQFNVMSTRLSESYQTLKEREERLALVIEATNDGIWDWNLETDAVYFSPRWKSMLGYADDEIAPHVDSWRGLLHPEDADRAAAHVRAFLSGKTPVYELEQRLRHKDGSYRWILARGTARYRADGKPYRLTGSHTDITERKLAEEATRQSEKRFSQVFLASPIPISITGLDDGRFIEVNDAWLRLFGYSRPEVTGTTTLGLGIWIHPEQRREMIARLEAEGSLRNFEHLTRTKSGEVRDLLASAEVIELNQKPYNLCLLFDITERKQAQKELERHVAERTQALATLNAISEVVSGTLDLKEIMNAALLKAMESMRMETGTAYSIQDGDEPEQDKRLSFAARQGLTEEFTRRVGSRRVRGTAIQVAAEARKPLVWLVSNYPDPQLKETLELEGVRQVINVPLVAKGKLVGAMNLGTRREREILPEELSLLAAIGRQVAIAVENARLYDRVEQAAALAERTRLARELHDSVTQSLYSVTMYAEAAQLQLTAGNHAPAAEYLRELRDTAQEALREMRLLIYELRPPALEQRGLATALQERLETVEVRGGVAAKLEVDGSEALPLSVQHELYRIAREALNNILKHAHAHLVQVHLVCAAPVVLLEICDDGVGFDPADPHRGGLGLAGMKERVQRIGGTLDIDTSIGQGTRLTVRVPIQFPEER